MTSQASLRATLLRLLGTAGVARSLRRALVEHQTILVIGGTGTGKTTFLNSLLAELAALCPEERIAVLEDTPELACASPDRISLRTGSGLDLWWSWPG
jgi:type IV secretion system protein VirB11